MLTKEMLTYRATPSQQRELRGALAKIRDMPRVSYNRLISDVKDWWLENRPSDEIYEFSLTPGAISQCLKNQRVPSDKVSRVLYAFFAFAPFEYGQLISLAGLGGVIATQEDRYADALLRHFNERHQQPYSNLSGLVSGAWEAYRPSWQRGGEGHVIRSHIEIERSGNAFWLRETQDFTFNFHVEEVDWGLLFPFSQAIVCLSRSTNHVCMKCYSFSSFEPAPSPDSPTEVMGGTVMAVSNKGPHWSGPIYLRRVANGKRGALEHSPIEKFDAISELSPAMEFLRKNEILPHLPRPREKKEFR